MLVKMKYRLLSFLLFFSCSVFSQKQEDADLTLLKSWMIGHFSSEQQAAKDSSFFHIELRMAAIFPDRNDGSWLYVEQAAKGSLHQPYRQRVYHLYRQSETVLVSKVFEMHQPLRFAGAWQSPSLLAAIVADSLINRQGCAIYLTKNDQGQFVGSTEGKQCLSSLRGATYATSEVRISSTGMQSWDRGWNATDQQVWGAVKGGYLFDKLKE